MSLSPLLEGSVRPVRCKRALHLFTHMPMWVRFRMPVPRGWDCHTGAMASSGVFVFADDGVQFFRNVDEAAGYVEAIDVEAGVYEAFVRLDGERLLPRVVDQFRVVLEPSGDLDPDGLIALLEKASDSHGGFASDARQPVSVANELLAQDWATRWPRWPHWLHRRLHGERPPRAEPT